MQNPGNQNGYYPPRQMTPGTVYRAPAGRAQGAPAPSPSAPPPSAPRPRGTKVQRRRRGHPVLFILLALLLAAGIAGGIYYYQHDSVAKPYQSVYLPNISIDGIPLEGMTRAQAEETVFSHIRARQNSFSLSLVYQGHTFTTLDNALMGVTTDEAEVTRMLDAAYQYGHRGDVFERAAEVEKLKAEPLAMYTAQSEMTDTNVDLVLSQIAAFFDRQPQDAYLANFNPDASDPFTIQKEVYGSYLDVDSVKAEILRRASSGESGALEITPTPRTPAVFEKDVRAQVTLLSEGVTAISKSSEEGRTSNIRLACTKLNGYILKPGKTFSFNNVVGKRTKANGFLEAPEYAYGELVTGIGGGVCQVSTTVYIAAVTSNLTILKRAKHSSPVNYTEKGQDATVYDGRIDFTFSNSSSGDIYMTAKVEKIAGTKNRYQCVVRIYGPTLGEKVKYKLRSTQIETLKPDPEPLYQKDTEGKYVTYVDETYKTQSAKDGSVIETYLQRWENNVMVEEHLITTDTYEPKRETYKVGVKRRE